MGLFTGIIEDVGTVERVQHGSQGGRTLHISTGLDPGSLAVGDSVATNGVCLTVTAKAGSTFTAEAGPTTILRTTIGQITAGQRVNLERSLTPASRIGGHFVAGHVDTVGHVTRMRRNQNAIDLDIAVEPEVLRLTVPRGSVAVDGISLTVSARGDTTFSVMIIPHTQRVTRLDDLEEGMRVNVEADLIARYLAGIFERQAISPRLEPRSALTVEFLAKHGFAGAL